MLRNTREKSTFYDTIEIPERHRPTSKCVFVAEFREKKTFITRGKKETFYLHKSWQSHSYTHQPGWRLLLLLLNRIWSWCVCAHKRIVLPYSRRSLTALYICMLKKLKITSSSFICISRRWEYEENRNQYIAFFGCLCKHTWLPTGAHIKSATFSIGIYWCVNSLSAASEKICEVNISSNLNTESPKITVPFFSNRI